MKILCGTDFTAEAGEAAALAGAWARRLGGSISLVHAYHLPAAQAPTVDGVAALELDRHLRALIEGALQAAAAPLRALGVEVDLHMREGPPDQVMAALCGGLSPDLLVVGDHHQGFTGRLSFGFVSDRLQAQVHTPMLVSRGDSSRLRAWCESDRPLRVVVGADLSETSDAALRWLRRLWGQTRAHLTVVHAYWPPGEYDRVAGAADRPWMSPDPAAVEALSARVDALLGPPPEGSTLEQRLWPSLGNIAHPIGLWAEREQADLVVVGSRPGSLLERLWRGSGAHAVLHNAPVPVLCIPPTPEVEAPRYHTFQRAIVLVDLQPGSSDAVGWACGALEPGGALYLVHPDPGPALEDPQLELSRARTLEDALVALVPVEALPKGLLVSPQLVEGDELVSSLRALNPDCVVGPLSSTLLGLSEQLQVPTLLTPSPEGQNVR